MLLSFRNILDIFKLHPVGIIHVGAWDGGEMEQYIAAGIDRVIFIEPQYDIFPTLQGRVAPYPKSRALNYCVSDEEGIFDFYVMSNGQSSSLLAPKVHLTIHPSITVTETKPMVVTTLQNIYKREKLNALEYDTLIIDVQGNELKVLKGAGGLLNNFKCIYLEINRVETYENCPHVDDIDKYLADFNFKRAMTGEWVAGSWTDSVYIKNN